MPTSADGTAFQGYLAHQQGRAVVVCSGEIDMAASASFRALLERAVKVSPHVVVDMRDVTFMDSSGLRVLAVANVHATGSVTLSNPSPVIVRLLELTRLDRFVAVQAEPHPGPLRVLS